MSMSDTSYRVVLWSPCPLTVVHSLFFLWYVSPSGASLAVWQKNADTRATLLGFESQILQHTNYMTLIKLLNNSQLPFVFL